MAHEFEKPERINVCIETDNLEQHLESIAHSLVSILQEIRDVVDIARTARKEFEEERRGN